MSHSERDQEVLSFFPLSFPLPNPETLGGAAGRGHLRSFLQHRQRRPPGGEGGSSERTDRARGAGAWEPASTAWGVRVAARRPGRSRPASRVSSHPRPARPPPPSPWRSLAPSLPPSLSNVFLPGREKLKGRTEKALCSLILRVSGQKLT